MQCLEHQGSCIYLGTLTTWCSSHWETAGVDVDGDFGRFHVIAKTKMGPRYAILAVCFVVGVPGKRLLSTITGVMTHV